MIDWPHLERRNAPLGAFVDWDKTAAFGTGALAGVSVGVKANLAVAGLPHTGGMQHRSGVIALADALCVARLRGAGAAILGTVNMHEAALGATTDNPAFGRTHNPHRIGYTPGGSSGGSAAAVAARLCDLALGTDTLGSIRIPAAYCGIYGLKPTFGSVPTEGMLFLDPGLDCIGPMSADLGLIERAWRVLAGPGAPVGDTKPFERFIVPDALLGIDCQPAVLAAHVRAFVGIELRRTMLSLPSSAEAIRRASLVRIVTSLKVELGSHVADGSDGLRWVIDAIGAMEGDDAMLACVADALREQVGDDGVLLLPTAPQAAFSHDTRPQTNQAAFTALASIAGLPALAVPAGCDADGLPVSVQLVGPRHSEARLIALARTLEPVLGGATLPPRIKET